jgi:hypothetical protein
MDSDKKTTTEGENMSSGWCVQIKFMYRVYIFARFYVTVKVTFDLVASHD